MLTGEEKLLVRGDGFNAHFSPNGDYLAFTAPATDMFSLDEVDEASLFGITENERRDLFLWVVESTGGTPRRIMDMDYNEGYEEVRLVGWSSEGFLVNYFPYSENPKNYNPPPMSALYRR